MSYFEWPKPAKTNAAKLLYVVSVLLLEGISFSLVYLVLHNHSINDLQQGLYTFLAAGFFVSASIGFFIWLIVNTVIKMFRSLRK